MMGKAEEQFILNLGEVDLKYMRAAGSELTCLNSGSDTLARDPLLAV